MPMDRNRYPKNWDRIAFWVKELNNWKCEKCGLECIKPGDNTDLLTGSERAKYTLTVHHCDYDPSNNDISNLRALCSGCHLQAHRGINGRIKSISPGQLKLDLKV